MVRCSPLLRGSSCDAPYVGKRERVAHVEFYFERHFDDRFGMTAVLEQRVFDGLGAGDEQAALEAVLLLGDPFALAIAAD